jgi:hypothetical protein
LPFLYVDLPRYSESVVDLNAEIAHGALDLRMAKQELNGTHVAGSPINQRRLGSVELLVASISHAASDDRQSGH